MGWSLPVSFLSTWKLAVALAIVAGTAYIGWRVSRPPVAPRSEPRFMLSRDPDPPVPRPSIPVPLPPPGPSPLDRVLVALHHEVAEVAAAWRDGADATRLERDEAEATYHKLVALEAEVRALRVGFEARRDHLRLTTVSAQRVVYPGGTEYVIQ